MSFPGIPSLDAAVMAFIQTHFHNTVTDTVFPIITSLVQRVHEFSDAHRAPHVLFVPLGPHIVKLCRSAYFDAPPQKSRLARVHSGSAHRVLPHFPFCPLPYRCPRRHPPRHPRRPPHLLCRQGDSKTTGREAHGTNLNRLFRPIKAARRFPAYALFLSLFSSFLSIFPTLSVHYARRLPEFQ